MSQLVQSRYRYPGGPSRLSTGFFFYALGIPFRQKDDQDFFEANAHCLRELWEQAQEEVRERMHELHPDKGGNTEEFRQFIHDWAIIKRRFQRHLPVALNGSLPSSVKFTPMWRIRLDRKAAQARARRKKNRVAFRAQRRAAYARKRATGWRPDPADAKARSDRYRKRHPIKTRRMAQRYRAANHDKVLQWKRNYYWRRGRFLPRKKRPEFKRRQRSIPGTPENEKFKKRRRAAYRKNRKKINARRRELRGALPRIRDHAGRYLPRPLAAAA
jgi:hypothetical protein